MIVVEIFVVFFNFGVELLFVGLVVMVFFKVNWLFMFFDEVEVFRLVVEVVKYMF